MDLEGKALNNTAGVEEQGSQPGSVQPTPLTAQTTPTPAPCSHPFFTQAGQTPLQTLRICYLSLRVPISGSKGSQAVPRKGGGCEHPSEHSG